ncbi:hypothetical protein PsYK624_052350 [Phanerochaete sordida]|uniref:Uncharacterized protein n=1 Tax=Phanerochaete sordida TaxID=48140 RepID=A0A9P3LB60_9APHY|nr:hypothetical protein PsYK624_052350 [Phanerochaete sordida]
MPGSSQLPISTTLGIIDHLGDDPVSLFTCSLVCLSWMTRSRAHTFYHLVVDDAARLRTLLGLLRGGTHSFRFCTRELYLGAQWPFPEHMDLSRDDFILLLASLPTLQALTLANIRWSADTPLPLACTPHTPRHLSTLRLYHLHAAGSAALGMAHLSSLLRLFSGIGALDMLYDADAAFSTDDAPAHACAKVRALPALGELTLLCSRAKPRIIRWLANAGVFDGLESLQLWLADEEAAVAFGRVVRASGKSLKTLGIYLIREGMLDATREYQAALRLSSSR